MITTLFSELRDGITSALERPGVQRILVAHGLPKGRGQVRETVAGAQVYRDRVIEPYGLVIEFDGRLGHADGRSRLRDFRRDNAVTATGRPTMRFGWEDVHDEACESAAQVARTLGRLGWPGIPSRCGPDCGL